MRIPFSSVVRKCGLLLASTMVPIVVLAGSQPALGSDDQPMRDAFVREYRPFAEKLQRQYRNVFSRYTKVTESADNKQLVETGETTFGFDYFRSGSQGRLVNKANQETLQTFKPIITCRNPQYSFAVGQNGPGEYVLSHLTVNSDKQRPLSETCAPYADYWSRVTYLDMAKDPGVRFLEFGDCRYQGMDAKRLVIRRPATNVVTGESIKVIVTIYFSPELDWACVGFGSDQDPPVSPRGYSERRYSYARADNGFLALAREERWRKTAAGTKQLALEEVITYSEFRPIDAPPETDFRLSAFGLPEPVGVVWERATPHYVWILFGAGVFALLALLFRYLARRKRQTVTA